MSEKLDGRCPRCGAAYALVGRVHRCVPREEAGDGVSLTSMEHPAGLIEEIAGAIRDWRLSTVPRKRGAWGTFDRVAYQREYMARWRARRRGG